MAWPINEWYRPTVRVFTYIEQLDAFVVTDEYLDLADRLGLTEWHPVVWIGRLFTLDNDYGEHWFDNWDEREALADAASKLGIASDELLIIVPDRLKNDADGPPPASIPQAVLDRCLKVPSTEL